MERFYPDDFVVTNPFNQFINTAKVLERVRTNIIKYKSYTRNFEYFRQYGDTVVVVGSELVIPLQTQIDLMRGETSTVASRRFGYGETGSGGRSSAMLTTSPRSSQTRINRHSLAALLTEKIATAVTVPGTGDC
jgi:hypothetical protein